MIPSPAVQRQTKEQILIIAGPTASGKSSRGVKEALGRGGEVISVDSRQVYRRLDIGTEKITAEEMQGVPHHLIDIRDPGESYSAGDFVADAKRLIADISLRGKLPILVGGTHFYFGALLQGLPMIEINPELRKELEKLPTEDLAQRVAELDPRRAKELDPLNRRRLIRALEIIDAKGEVPARAQSAPAYAVEWIVIDPSAEELRTKINARLASALARGLIDEVHRVREEVGDTRMNELGLEYKVVGDFLRACPTPSVGHAEASLLPALSAKLWQYTRRQKAWLRKLHDENIISAGR